VVLAGSRDEVSCTGDETPHNERLVSGVDTQEACSWIRGYTPHTMASNRCGIEQGILEHNQSCLKLGHCTRTSRDAPRLTLQLDRPGQPACLASVTTVA
jgi:hypothetical protein